MNIQVIVPLILTTLIAIFGWYVAHKLSSRRDLANKRRELRVQYLIDAYRRLEYAGNRPLTKELAPEFEKAIADVQLFGTLTQLQLSKEFALGFAENGTYPLDSLLNELRNDLRKELDLESARSNITYLRITFDKKDSLRTEREIMPSK